ncbi:MULTISPECIES: ThiF family adenylyltransferase [Sphingopyxis]|jgi:hypothetical protein|uniref:UBA/THIF-type NAD/FAD binding protein n=1 Tax=Sphingopyxis granuli TaxID=267128 RepID=A0AA86L263_9SPHN|nr:MULTISPECIES: ThiF family adenylyltransferase [Sphingopyxis]AMG72430.1 UBA/THIF-type NAD/FAD binding protein [Sphingopyxis granuli]MBR2174783.1 ThiF family adenylyltransferase [Sphingopyxis sp.]
MHILRLNQSQHATLASHLFDGTGLEAIAVGLCGRSMIEGRSVFVVHRIVEIPSDECLRAPDRITWPTCRLKALLAEARANNLAILKIHSHPGGYRQFSSQDDASDLDLFNAVGLKVVGEHVSAIMLPDGSIFGRRVGIGGPRGMLDRVSVVGDDILIWPGRPSLTRADFDVRHRQMFGDHTTESLGSLSVGVVGVSGSGSPTVEMLVRLGVRRVVLIEPDHVEAKNLNRIYGATRRHAAAEVNKARMMKNHIDRIGLGTKVEIVEGFADSPEAIARLATCDVLFGCMDSIEGRDTLNRIATFYTLPYFDLGVRIDADGSGGVNAVSGVVHYIQPGGSSLRSRGVYSEAELHADVLRRTDPDFYEDQVRRGYVRGIVVDRPAVISINTMVASMAVNELLARLHPFRTRPNGDFAIQRISMSHGRIILRPDGEPDANLASHVGRGTTNPPLLLPRLGRPS